MQAKFFLDKSVAIFALVVSGFGRKQHGPTRQPLSFWWVSRQAAEQTPSLACWLKK